MYSNTIQARIEATLKDLYKVHDTVFKPAVMYTMYSNIRSYFIILDKDNKAQLLNAFNPRVVKHEDKLELDSVTDSPRIYQEYFIKEFSDNVDYGIYIDEDEIGHYFTTYGEVQIFSNYIQVNYNDYKQAEKLLEFVKPLPEYTNKIVTYDLVVSTNTGFSTTECTSSRNIDIDVKKNYNDDFLPEYDKLVKFIKQKESGIALAHGIVGSGKTMVIRHLTTHIPGNYIFITPSIASYLGNPEFVSFLLDNKNSIFILEDCEQLLRERTENTFGTSIANILNMTDGILSDIFNIKFICTFNASETVIDPALLREGRCYFNYKFDKLKADKVAVLNKENNLGIPEDEICDMTLAELYNYSGSKKKKETKKIGF